MNVTEAVYERLLYRIVLDSDTFFYILGFRGACVLKISLQHTI